MNKKTLLPLMIALLTPETFARAIDLSEIEVAESTDAETAPLWEETRGTEILSGKKNTVTKLKDIPQIQTNNYRQATTKTAGLLVSETPNESSAGITYRGLGDPHESFNILLLQDGLPVATDMYGYPAAYFTPALPMLDSMHFIRGGGSLIYGPQPGGVLNFISRPLKKNQPVSGRVGLTGGSYNLLTTNNALYGSKSNHAYGLEYFRRQGDGMQRQNSDFYADYVQARDVIFNGKDTFTIALNGYNSDHGNPGGFSKQKGANLNTFGDDRGKSTTPYDRLRVSRAQLALKWERRIDDRSHIQTTLWGSAYHRYSKTQNGASFGKYPTGTTNSIQTQDFFNYSGEVRYVRNYLAFSNEHTFSAGYMTYNLNSPYIGETGAAVDSNHGTVTRRLDRSTIVNSWFAENRFTFGKWMITPGMRLENIRQTIDERKNTVTNVLRKEDVTANVPLFGLGVAYQLTDSDQLYANASEAYKPVSFQETIPLASTASTISEDIKPSKIYSYEVGYRGMKERLNWDVSAFYIRYENKFGQVGNNFQNTGASTNTGFDIAGDYRLNQSFSFFANTEFLWARFTRGPQKDGTPQYAPKNLTRTGIIYRHNDEWKVGLMGVMVGRHFGNDSNGNGTNKNDYEIPFYTVWDLTADWNFKKNWMFSGGINNLLDREYFSKVRAGGVQWAMNRNFYAGLTYKF